MADDPGFDVVIGAKIDQLQSGLQAAEVMVKQAAERTAAAAEKASGTTATAAEKAVAATSAAAEKAAAAQVAASAKAAAATEKTAATTAAVAAKAVATTTPVLAKEGEKAGAAFAGNVVKQVASLGAVAMVAKRAMSDAIASAKAGESGAEIGTSFFRGAVEGAKQIPIAGAFVALLDHAINGAAEAAEAKAANLGRRMAEALAESLEAQKAQIEAVSIVKESLADQKAINQGEEALIKRSFEKRQAAAKKEFDARVAANERVYAAAIAAANSEEALVNAANANIRKATLEAEKDLATQKTRIRAEELRTLNKMEGDAREARRAEDAEQAERRKAEVAKEWEEQSKIQADALKKVQDQIVSGMGARIEAMKKASEPTRAERLRSLVESAADPMIQSGQTALGTFKTAQGSGAEVIRVAESQLKRLEEIERLQREMRDYQKQIASGMAA